MKQNEGLYGQYTKEKMKELYNDLPRRGGESKNYPPLLNDHKLTAVDKTDGFFNGSKNPKK
ncbi:MAG: hypothetical protein OEM02_06815 [Desulfobulbaceae bacterium]|nr:hypothetical protein [Desulfobulbaceae bacterium]